MSALALASGATEDLDKIVSVSTSDKKTEQTIAAFDNDGIL